MSSATLIMTQEAPYPHELDEVVSGLAYAPGWKFSLEHAERKQGGSGLNLAIVITTGDIYRPGENLTIRHDIPVPAVHYTRRFWARWVFDRIMDVERHEAMEKFTIGGARVFAPLHDEGCDPYTLAEPVTEDPASDYLCNYVQD